MELVRLIAASKDHPSANQFYEKIKEKFPTMSHATVYKTLALLKEMDQVCEINLREDSHYDGNRPEQHPHLICLKCNKIIDGDVSIAEDEIRRVEDETGYVVLRQQLVLYGLCSNCRVT